jgi:hypothetical protein
MITAPAARLATLEPAHDSVALAQYCATLGLKCRHAAGLGWCAQIRGTRILVAGKASPFLAILEALRLRALSLAAA